LDNPKTQGESYAGVPATPPMVTAKEPDENDKDEDEIVFIATWYCVASEDLPIETVLDDSENRVDEKEEEKDDMVFVAAWCCVASGNLPSKTTLTHLPIDEDEAAMTETAMTKKTIP
jgi:hypothetical protein